MAVVVLHPETQGDLAEDIWRLVFLVQQATLRLHEDSLEETDELTTALLEHPLFSEMIRAKIESPETVAIHQCSAAATPIELLQRLLLAIEDGDGSTNGWQRRYREAVSCLQASIHRYLQVSLKSSSKHRSVDRLVQRSMYHFAYGLSHEINNPLANITARAAQLVSSVANEREKKSLMTIVEQAMKAHEMLAEMMLAVQLPSLTFASGDLRSLMLELSREWSVRAADRSIGWYEAIGDDFLWSVFDRIALSEAISAGIRNALEACRSGDTLSLIAERTESTTGELEIRIAIVDNGPGLSQKGLEQAWDLYFSGREAGRGLGIGLAKVRRIIETHRGRVWLVSKERQGCAMEIRLPWKRIPRVA